MAGFRNWAGVGRWSRRGVLLGLLALLGCAHVPRTSPTPPATAWAAAWGSAQLLANAPAANVPAPAAAWRAPLQDASVRQLVRVTLGGTQWRVRISNVLGTSPLRVGAASVAAVVSAPAGVAGQPPVPPVLDASSLRPLLFAGLRELTVPAGAEAWSDPVALPLAPLADLAVQLHVVSGAEPATVHPGSRIASWALAGDHVAAAAWPGATPRDGWWHLAAVDVAVPAAASPPVLVATGDSITDGYGVPPGSHQRWTDALARRVQAAGRTAAVVNTGIGGGRLLRDGLGPHLLSRLDRDVLDRSGVTHAVVLVGVNDLGAHHREKRDTAASRAALLQELKTGFQALARRARERGVCLIAATVLPYAGSGYYQPRPENEADRVALNDWLRGAGLFDAIVDFDTLMRDPQRPAHLRPDLDSGDGLHPSMAGYRAMADGFPLDLLDRRCGARPAASTSAAPLAMPTDATRLPPTFDNPVVSGFAADPSVCRSGDDYYLVHSSFEYLPGLPIHHSRDLVHWRLVGHGLSRHTQMSLAGRKSSKGQFAPTIRCDGGRFSIVGTDVDGLGSFLITAADPAGPWSDPIALPEPEFTMDPSLFFDDDGTVYYTRHGGGRHGGVYQARIDITAGRLLEPPRLIWRGMGGIWPEGPHLYKRQGWYYLMIAEGGTSYEHRITMARSRSPWGPFEPHPDNPILTHQDQPGDTFQALGHADLVTTPQGAWWATLLAIRPQQAAGGRHHHIGRETLLAPVRWRDDGWPEIGQQRRLLQPQPTTGLPAWAPWPTPAVRETFAPAPALPLHWVVLRTLEPRRWSLAARPGHLRLLGDRQGLDTVGSPAFVARRQESLHQRFATQMDFQPRQPGDAAGLALRQNEDHHVLLRVVGDGSDARRVECVQRSAQGTRVLATSPLPAGPVQLQVLATPARYALSWRSGAGAGAELCEIPTHALSTETTTGFTGVFMGLHATSGGAQPAVADFAWVDFEAPAP